PPACVFVVQSQKTPFWNRPYAYLHPQAGTRLRPPRQRLSSYAQTGSWSGGLRRCAPKFPVGDNPGAVDKTLGRYNGSERLRVHHVGGPGSARSIFFRNPCAQQQYKCNWDLLVFHKRTWVAESAPDQRTEGFPRGGKFRVKELCDVRNTGR